MKSFLQNLEGLVQEKLQILSLRLKVNNVIHIGYFLIYYLFRFQVTWLERRDINQVVNLHFSLRFVNHTTIDIMNVFL